MIELIEGGCRSGRANWSQSGFHFLSFHVDFIARLLRSFLAWETVLELSLSLEFAVALVVVFGCGCLDSEHGISLARYDVLNDKEVCTSFWTLERRGQRNFVFASFRTIVLSLNL